jgi:Class III cytochrome C family
MTTESKGQLVIFSLILILIFGLSYCSIPLQEPVQSKYKLSKKAQTKILSDKKDAKSLENDIEIVEKPALSNSEAVNAPSKEIPVETGITRVEQIKPDTKIVQAQNDGPLDIIIMNNSLYKVHTKGIVQFTHKTHVEKYLIACGACHHDEKGKPLDLKADDTVKGCIECHKGTKKSKGEKLGKKEKIAKYHFEALHANCIGCHKDYNKQKGDAKGKGPAPSSCKNCHPKK